MVNGCPRQSDRRWAIVHGQQRDAALMADLGWPNSWRKNCPPSVNLAKNMANDGIFKKTALASGVATIKRLPFSLLPCFFTR